MCLPTGLVKHTEDIIFRMTRIRQARILSESPTMTSDDIEILRSFIMENRQQIPAFALSHFDRLEASGGKGIAEIIDGKCSACGASVPEDEIEFLNKNKNIGVCDGCFCFIHLPNEKFNDDGFFKRLLNKE